MAPLDKPDEKPDEKKPLATEKKPLATAKEPPSKAKRILLFVGLGLVALGAAYGAGFLTQHLKLGEAEELAGTKDQETQKAKRDVDQERAKVMRLEARRHLHLALLDMEARNFGMAQEHATQAGALLVASAPEGEMKQLAQEVKAFRLTASEDQSSDRKTILGFAEKLDKLMPPAKL